MGLKNCEILFDNNPWKTYKPGDTVTGHIVYTFNSPKRVKGIKLTIKGEASVSWSETHSTRDRDGKTKHHTIYYKGDEQYFKYQFYVLGGDSSDPVDLPEGKHTYPFTYSLPPSLPSSFEGSKGYIRYTIKSTLDRPWKFDQDTKVAYTVISPVDLNFSPNARNPVRRETSKSFCCMCCKSGPLQLSVSIPMTGYVSGQKIPITIDVDNASNVDIVSIELVLRKRVLFHATRPRHKTREDKIDVKKMSIGPVNAHGNHTCIKQLEIPSLPPSSLVNCRIIDLDYELKVDAIATECHSGPDVKLPIIIGTIPLIEQMTPVITPSAPFIPSGPVNVPVASGSTGIGWNAGAVPTDTKDLPPSYSDFLPPSYEECMYGTKSIQEPGENENCFGKNDFAPRYPVYVFPPTAPPSIP